MSILAQLIAAIYKVTGPAPPPGPSFGTQSFTYTGYEQTFTVPAGVTELNVKMWGAGGAGGSRQPISLLDAAAGGGAGSVSGTVAVTPGETLGVVVGQGGRQNNTGSSNPTSYGGGGLGWGGGNQNGGGGGGLSSLYRGDFYYQNTSALLHMNPVYGNTAFNDNSVNNFTVSNSGGTQIRTNQSAYSNQSVVFDGSGDYLSVPDNAAFDLSGDFTVEAWVYFNNTNDMGLCSGSSTGSFDFAFVGGQMRIGRINTAWDTSASFVRTAGIWYHVAWCRTGSTVNFFVNGQIVGTATNAISYEIAGGGSLLVGSSGTSDRYFNGYISNLRILKGVALYTTTFTPPTSALTAITGTSLLTCQSNRFIDNSTNNFTVTVTGNAAISGSNPYSNQSVYLDGTGDYLVAQGVGSFDFSADFTVECWLLPISNVQPYPTVWANYSSYGAASMALFAGHTGANASKYQLLLGALGFPAIQSTTSIAYNSWTHLAVVRSGSTVTLYINGVSEGTATSSANYTASSGFWIGVAGDNLTLAAINGNISNLRIVSGTAVYTSNFTPPTTPLTAISGTSLLTCQSNKFIDNSANNCTITANGNSAISVINPIDTSGSSYFNGSGQYLFISNNSAFNLSTNNFTIELWYNPSEVNNYRGIVAVGSTNSTGISIQQRIDGALNLVYGNGSGGLFQQTSGITLSVGVWYHLALVRNGLTITLYVNGTSYLSFTGPNSLGGGNWNVYVGQGFGIGGGLLELQTAMFGYIDDLRITNGVARYVANFTPPTSQFADPADFYYNNNTLLLHLDGTNGSTTFTDNSPSPKTLTAFGSASITTVQRKFGTGSLNIPSASDGITTSGLNLDTNFTIEGWVKPAISGSEKFMIIQGVNLINGFLIALSTSEIRWRSDGTTDISAAISKSDWYHFAIVRNGSGTNNVKVYVDGVQVTQGTYTNTILSAAGNLNIGACGALSGGFASYGYIDEFRITNGVARYTTAFNPPVNAFANSNGFIAIAAGGGGGGSVPTTALGGVGGGTTGGDGVIGSNAGPGLGGTQTAGGAAATASSGTPTSGSLFTGGNAAGADGSGGGGGAGYYGGGGGGGTSNGGGGGGGGSSYTGILTSASTASGSGTAPGNSSDSARSGAGEGGAQRVTGSNGLVYLQWGTLSTQTFAYTGYLESFTVPSGVTSLYVSMWGAGGGSGGDSGSGANSRGGAGGFLKFTTAVTPGEILTAQVGSGGLKGPSGGQVRRPGTGGGMSSIVRGDPFYSDVSLLLHMDGANNSQTFTDDGNYRLSPSVIDGAKISTSTSKFGGGSASFQLGDYLAYDTSPAFVFGIDDFTIEMWVYAQNTYGSIYDSRPFLTDGNYVALTFLSSTLTLTVNGSALITSSTPLPQGDWVHIALSRSNGTTRLFQNGVIVGSASDTTNYANAAGRPIIGRNGYDTTYSLGRFVGFIDEFRITKGTARYVAAFTPPTAAFSDPQDQYFDNVSLLLHMSGTNGSTTFTDSSNSGRTPTFVGTPSITTSTSKWNTSSGNFASGRLEYSGYNLATTNDFTAEAWVYHPSSLADGQLVIIGQQASSAPLLTILNGKLSSQLSGGYTDGPTTFPKDQWVHVAISRSSSTCRLYLNGVQETSFSTSNGMSSLTVGGGYSWGTGSGLLLDDVRITNNVARYTSNFNPPNREFANGNGIVAIVGAGGGGGGYGNGNINSWGGSGGDTTANAGGAASVYATGGGAGTSTAGGAAGTPGVGLNGSYLQGGAGAGYNLGTQTLSGWPNGGIAVAIDERGGGGGGGYYGGGGGGGDGTWGAGGGGGSSYTGTGVTAITHAKAAQNTVTAPGNTESGYVAGVANGGQNFNDGGNGLIYISW